MEEQEEVIARARGDNMFPKDINGRSLSVLKM